MSEWLSGKLGGYVKSRKGKKPKKLTGDVFDNCVSYIDIKAFESGLIRQFAEIESSKLASNNDVLMVWDGARSGLVGKGIYGAIGSTIAAISSDNIEKDYLYYFLKMNYAYINSHTKGTGIPHVDPSVLWDINIIAPLDVEEQQLIIERLEKRLKQLNIARERLSRIPLLLKRFRQSALSSACSGKLTASWREGKELDEWKERQLRSLCSKFQYGTSQKSDKKGSVPVLRMGNIQNGKIDWSDLVFTSDERDIKKYALNKGDVLFNRTNSPEHVGKTAIYESDQPAIFAGYLIKIHNNKSLLDSWYLNCVLNTLKAKEYCQLVKSDGVNQSNINAQKLADFVFSTPPLPEQEEIVRRVDKLFSIVDNIEERYNKVKEKLDKVEKALYSKAFKGEL